jgi:DNA repair protein RecN (Recombination protein N)
MLRELRIKNFTIIDDLTLNFKAGLNVLTGETGAGKSIIVGALGILLGDKASQEIIKTGAKEANIEAYFDNRNHPALEELSIESDEGIIIRRNISSQGKGRAYINDTPVNVQTLSVICRNLVDIHGQHEHQGLLRKESHLAFLDSFGELTEDVNSLRSLYAEVVSLRNAIAAMKERARERSQRIEFLKFQINEIDSAVLKTGEKESIEEERAILLNLNKLKESSETAHSLLYGSERSCIEQLSTAVSRIKDMAQIDHSAEELLSLLQSAFPLIEDASLSLRKFKDKYDIDPQRLVELDERLELIKRLEKKYGDGAEAILRYREGAEDELKNLEHIDERMEGASAEIRTKEEELLSTADRLSVKRKSAAHKMEKMVIHELRELGFQKAEFRVDIRKHGDVSSNGMDDVEFLFSANPGEPPKPLIKVASGGELSRIMLALKCIEIGQEFGIKTAQGKKKIQIPDSQLNTLIFDEVDAGIGGVTARHVASRLKAISGTYQVFCITHLPQIAALSEHHLRVEKSILKDSVKVAVEPLTGDKRHEELARMLSGRVTESSLRHAQELLNIDKNK